LDLLGYHLAAWQQALHSMALLVACLLASLLAIQHSYGKSQSLMGKSSIDGPFSMAKAVVPADFSSYGRTRKR